MRRCIIFGAAEIKNYKRISSLLNKEDFIIVCDGGLAHTEKLELIPNLIVGDFDSHERPDSSFYKESEIIQLPCEKDDTDLFYAAKEAVNRGYRDFIIFGAIGNRFDHSLCNISVLLYLKNQNASCRIIDDYSELEIISDADKEPAQITEDNSYFSLMCFDGSAEQVTIKDAKYPLENAKITTEYQFAISNKVLPGKTATVQIKKGKLLLIKVW